MTNFILAICYLLLLAALCQYVVHLNERIAKHPLLKTETQKRFLRKLKYLQLSMVPPILLATVYAIPGTYVSLYGEQPFEGKIISIFFVVFAIALTSLLWKIKRTQGVLARAR